MLQNGLRDFKFSNEVKKIIKRLKSFIEGKTYFLIDKHTINDVVLRKNSCVRFNRY